MSVEAHRRDAPRAVPTAVVTVSDTRTPATDSAARHRRVATGSRSIATSSRPGRRRATATENRPVPHPGSTTRSGDLASAQSTIGSMSAGGV